jgi:signal transduction histidine kinase
MILRSVTSRLVASYCLLLVLLGGVFLLFTVISFQQYTRRTVTADLETRAQLVWNTAQGLLDQPQRLAEIVSRRFAPESADRFIRIRVAGKLAYRSSDPATHDFSAGNVPLPDPDAPPRTQMIGNFLLYSRTFESPQGPVTIDAGESYLFARQMQQILAMSLFVGLPLLLIAASLAGYVLMRRALTPVEVMINAAEAYSFNDPHSRLPLVGAEPRIEALGLALNRMLDRLDNAYAHVSRFSADAAHELRTPLTIIRGELELIVAQTKASPEVDRAISNALEEMMRLSGIVDSLITLSRMESLWGKRTHASLDLLALAAETIDQMGLMAVEKQIALEGPSGPAVIVAGDRDRLKQMLVNLIDNAIKYTPEGGRVRVSVGAIAAKAVLVVEDSGIGIDPNHHDRIFDRFYRVVPDRGEVGAGLGLAIVKSICHAHGGTVTVRSVPEVGSSFDVQLSLLQAPTDLESKMAAAETAAANSAEIR